MRDGFHYKYWVYILTSRTGTLYIGITGYFDKHIHQHKFDTIEGFPKSISVNGWSITRTSRTRWVAISREKQIKRWRREKKVGLIVKLNLRWQDLAENWGREMRFAGQSIAETP
jgi:putative endonuclease